MSLLTLCWQWLRASVEFNVLTVDKSLVAGRSRTHAFEVLGPKDESLTVRDLHS